MDNILGERIKLMRKHYNWTQQELAEKLGVTSASISSWESGARRPDFVTLDSMCDIFKASMDYLLGRTDTNEYLTRRLDKLRDEYCNDDAEYYESLVNLFLTLDGYGKGAVEDLIKSENNRCVEQGTLQNEAEFQVMIRVAKKKHSIN